MVSNCLILPCHNMKNIRTVKSGFKNAIIKIGKESPDDSSLKVISFVDICFCSSVWLQVCVLFTVHNS